MCGTPARRLHLQPWHWHWHWHRPSPSARAHGCPRASLRNLATHGIVASEAKLARFAQVLSRNRPPPFAQHQTIWGPNHAQPTAHHRHGRQEGYAPRRPEYAAAHRPAPPAAPAWPPTPVVMSHVRADQPAVVPYADPNEKANSDPDFAGMYAVRWITRASSNGRPRYYGQHAPYGCRKSARRVS